MTDMLSFRSRHSQVLLSPEEEDTLFLDFKTEPSERRRQRLLDKIVVAYQPIVRKTVRDLAGYGVDSDELMSEGHLGLVEAAYRFDLTLGWRFSTYAKRWVHGKMLGFIVLNKFPVNICTNSGRRRLFFRLRKLVSGEFRRSGAFEMTNELATKLALELEVTVEEVYRVNNLFRYPHTSLNMEVGADTGEGKMMLQDLLSSDEPSPEQSVETTDLNAFQAKIVNEAVDAALTEREKRIFAAQRLSEDESQLTLESLGSEFGISKERIRQLRNVARTKVERQIRLSVRQNHIKQADLFA